MSRLYVGRLASRTRERDLEDAFSKYGKIRSIDLKYGFAFVEFSDPRDADDAIRGLDGRDLDGARVQVELARGGRRGGDEKGFGAAGVSRSEHRLLIEGISRDVSWQDLKDHFRSAGDILFTDVFPDREGRTKGVVEYRNRDDLKTAISKLDGTEIRGSRITVREDDGKESIPPPQIFRRRRSPPRRGRSPSPRRGRSRSRTPPRRRSPSPRRRSPSPRRRSPSPRRDKSPAR